MIISPKSLRSQIENGQHACGGERVMLPRATVMTDDEKQRLREIAGKATPGPWSEQHWKGAPDGTVYATVEHHEWIANASVENAAFIAAASPQTVLGLLDALDGWEQLAKQYGELLIETMRVSGDSDLVRRMHEAVYGDIGELNDGNTL